MLGFRIDPVEKLHEVHKEISALYTVYSQCPVFGVEFILQDKVQSYSSHNPDFTACHVSKYKPKFILCKYMLLSCILFIIDIALVFKLKHIKVL